MNLYKYCMGLLSMGIFLSAISGIIFSGRELRSNVIISNKGEENETSHVSTSILLSALCYSISAALIALDAWVFDSFQGLLHTEILNTERGAFSVALAIICLLLGLLFYGLGGAKKEATKMWFLFVIPVIIGLVQMALIEKESEALSKSGWLSYMECKKELKEWDKADLIPVIESGVGTGGQVFFKINKSKVDLSKVADWKTKIFLGQEEFHELALRLETEGYEFHGAVNYKMVEGKSRVQATWVKMKDPIVEKVNSSKPE